MFTTAARSFVPESVLRRNNTLYHNEVMRRVLEQEQAAAQLTDIEHCRIALSCLIQEACLHDSTSAPKQPQQQQTMRGSHRQSNMAMMLALDDDESAKLRVSRWIQLEDDVVNSADDYQTAVAKLSSMMLWDAARRRFDYEYHESELHSRRANQIRTLQALESQSAAGGSRFFLEPPPAPAPSSTPSASHSIVASRAGSSEKNSPQQQPAAAERRPATFAQIAASLGGAAGSSSSSLDEEAECNDTNSNINGSASSISSNSFSRTHASQQHQHYSNNHTHNNNNNSNACLVMLSSCTSSANSSPHLGPSAVQFDMSSSSVSFVESAGTSPLVLTGHQQQTNHYTVSDNLSFCSSASDTLACAADAHEEATTGRALRFSPLGKQHAGCRREDTMSDEQ